MEFKEVKREHILKGIEDYESEGIPDGFKDSIAYDLIHNDKSYPPKVVMAYANYHAIGKEISNYFEGGPKKSSFKALIREGFKVLPKSRNNYWVFHCNPKYWDGAKEVDENDFAYWKIAKKHINDIKEGDKFLFWVSGKDAGVYACGEISGDSIDEDVLLQRIEKYNISSQTYPLGDERVILKFYQKFNHQPISRDLVFFARWLVDEKEQYNFFKNPQGVTSKSISYKVYDEFLDLANYTDFIKGYSESLRRKQKKTDTYKEYVRYMSKIENWFIQNEICDDDFNIWRDVHLIDQIQNAIKKHGKKNSLG